MKKYLFILAAAAALVACSKTELVPAVTNDAETEITYTVAPKVRADVKDFDKTWSFISNAFYLANTDDGNNALTWASHAGATPSQYIVDKTISYITDDAVWRSADNKKYYWPKAGKLTFFAYTNATETVAYDANTGKGVSSYKTFATSDIVTATVDATNGVQYTNFSVVDNQNVDLLVADIEADQTKNLTNDYGNFGETDKADRVDKRGSRYTGVPTLFKHKLSKVVFTATTKVDYGTEYKFTINSIKFNGLDVKGSYAQGVDAASCTGAWTSVAPTAGTDDVQTYFESTDAFAVPNTTSVYEVYGSTDGQYYYMPQTFDENDTFTVDYNITYNVGNTTTTEKNIKQVCTLKPTTGTAILNAFEIGKKYTINLIFGLDEILWDPAVEEWAVESAETTINPTV